MDATLRSRLRRLMDEHALGPYVSERRKDRMLDVIGGRLTSVTVVLENLYDPHNVSAVVRTAEGFGLHQVHVVEQPNKYTRCAAILRGSDRWVDIVRHDGLNRCLSDLMADGYTLAVADVGEGCVPVEKLDVTGKLAVVMGSERDGLSKRAKQLADVRFTIPMAGFTESFNVSVSAAITLYEVTRRRRQLATVPELTEAQLAEHLVQWMRRSVKNAADIEARVAQEQQS